MINKEKVSVSWSGGKDCAFALHKVFQEHKYEVVSLHTSIDYTTKKVGIHGIPEALIEKQAKLMNIPLEKIYLNIPEKTQSYEETMLDFYRRLKSRNIYKIISGDIFLEDLRVYKEALAAKENISIELPLWGNETGALIEDFINSGFRTLICAADAAIFPPDTIGKIIDKEFIEKLPEAVDPCGENGEFHTFTFEGPVFMGKLDFEIKNVISECYNFKTTEGREINRKFFYAELK